MTQRGPVLLTVGALATIVAIWLVPPLGFVLATCWVVVLLPWGAGLVERVLAALIGSLGLVTLVSTRLVPLPITSTSVHILLSLVILILLGISLKRGVEAVRFPRVGAGAWLMLVSFVLSAAWLLFAYLGRTQEETLAGLFFTGWDNHGHFTTFANTYESGSMSWPTADGSTPWNQWYPTLHTTLWSIGQLAIQSGGMDSRPELLTPFVMWSGLSAALSFAVMAWVSGDLAARLVAQGTDRASASNWARSLATLGATAFFLLGSSSRLFNYGFTNFIMGVAVIVVASYLATSSLTRARRVGPACVTLAGLATIGLWTPLILGLVPAGVVVFVSLWKTRPILAISWGIPTAALLGGITFWQSRQILAAAGTASSEAFGTNLGGITGGSVPFNLALAMAAPLIAICLGIVLGSRRGWSLAMGVAGPACGATVLVAFMLSAADSSGTARLQSYYVLKSLNAVLLMAIPLIVACIAIAVTMAMAGLGLLARPKEAVLIAVASGAVGLAAFGFIGFSNATLAPGFATAPGIVGAIDRVNAVNDPLAGEAILRATAEALPYQKEFTTMIWDGAGTLPNLWVQSLTGVLTRDRQLFIAGLPPFPYGNETVEYVKGQMSKNPNLRLAMLWFRDPTRVLLEPLRKTKGDYFVELVKVPMRSSNLCPECSL